MLINHSILCLRGFSTLSTELSPSVGALLLKEREKKERKKNPWLVVPLRAACVAAGLRQISFPPGAFALGSGAQKPQPPGSAGVYPTRSTASDQALWSTVLLLALPMTSGPRAAPPRPQHTRFAAASGGAQLHLQLQQ